MNSHEEILARVRALECQVRWHRRVTMLFLCVPAAVAVAAFQPADRTTRFTEIDVERINVVEPNGGLAVVISNRTRIPGVIVAGREAPRELSAGREGAAGLLFFNARGDEVGGLTYMGEETTDGHRAYGHLSFDQYRQQDVVTLQYLDDGQRRRAGLNVWDRPTDLTLEELIDAVVARREGRETTGARDVGAHRVFLGSDDRVAALRLMDASGRPRMRLTVDAAGTPRLEFLDSRGVVTDSLPHTPAVGVR